VLGTTLHIFLFPLLPNYVEHAIELCRSLSEDSRLLCFGGIAGGHLKYGDPQNGYIKTANFCDNSLLQDDERETCYASTLPFVQTYFGSSGKRNMCKVVPSTYRSKYCEI